MCCLHIVFPWEAHEPWQAHGPWEPWTMASLGAAATSDRQHHKPSADSALDMVPNPAADAEDEGWSWNWLLNVFTIPNTLNHFYL